MRDILDKFYGIKNVFLVECNSGVKFEVGGYFYYLVHTDFDDEYLDMIYQMTFELKKINVKTHDFVLNLNNKLLSDGYVLFKVNVLNLEITLDDINKFCILANDELIKYYVPMHEFWENKIDYINYQIQELSDKRIINNSFDYYSGICEIIINNLRKYSFDGKLYLAHRIFSMDALDFYNPLNITIDLYYRDIAAYIRLNKDEGLLYDLLKNFNGTYYEYIYLFSRMVLPYEYFNILSDVLLNSKNVKELADYVNSNDSLEEYLGYMEKTFGIRVFNWLKKE